MGCWMMQADLPGLPGNQLPELNVLLSPQTSADGGGQTKMPLVPGFWREKIRIFSCIFIPPLLVIKSTFYFDLQFIHQFLVCGDMEVGRKVIVKASSTYSILSSGCYDISQTQVAYI